MDSQKNLVSDGSNEVCSEDSSATNASKDKSNESLENVHVHRTIRKAESTTSFSNNSLSTDSKSKNSASFEQEKSDIYCSQTSSAPQDVSPRASMNQALKSEKAFIEYVMSLPSTPASSDSPQLSKAEAYSFSKQKQKLSSLTPSVTSTTKVGLDHLDNLCKLMEQLSELRETNTKLQKRVQYLEDLKTLHEMHKEIRSEVKYGSENVLSQRKQLCLRKSLTDYARGSPRGSEDYALSPPRGSEEHFFQEQRLQRGRRSPLDRRSRTLNNPPYDGHRRERSKSVGHEEVYDGKTKRIFPKWSKVKEAFGWESDRKYSAKGTKIYYGGTTGTAVIGENILPGCRRIFTDNDIAALRQRLCSNYSEKDEISPMDSYAGEAMAACSEAYIAPFSSSNEDMSSLIDAYRSGPRHSKRDSGSSEKRYSLLEPQPDGLRRLKSAPSPGNDKTRVYREILDQKPKSLTLERVIDQEQTFQKFEKDESKKSHKSPWGRVKTIIERRRDSLKRRHLRRGPCHSSPPIQSRDHGNIEDIDDDTPDGTTSYDSQRKSSDDQLTLTPSLIKADYRCIDESDRKRKKQSIERLKKAQPSIGSNPVERMNSLDNRVTGIAEREVMFRTPSSSPQFHRKSTWVRMKNALRNKKECDGIPVLSSQSMPSSPNGVHDGTFDFEDTEGMDDNTEDVEYESGREITRGGSDSYVHSLALSSATAPVTNIMLELQRNISDDFNRKMQEWERIRNSGMKLTTSPKLERKDSGPKSRKKIEKPKVERYEKSPKPKVKDLTWLEKELQKIEKEKQRLSKEKEKYEERAIRLERLRQTVLTARNSNKKEVLVRTSAGEFRFEGISDAFTKKLYEWETKRGLGPELSTIALLDSSLGPNSKNCLTIQQMDKCSSLQRTLSRSESSIADIGQPSHTSSNSLPSLKPQEIGDLERIHHHSRANSEPDLSSYMGTNNNANASQHTLTNQSNPTVESSRDTLETDTRDSYVHPEVTQLIDSDVDDVLQDLEDHRQAQRDENYYSLLEENVILLEQLKNKEEICRRLEKELHLLDEKVDEMNKHHQQEMERYREKLWEMHKPGSTPREVQGCLQVMVELRSRIENLETCSVKLKNEKETLEDRFRFHSAEQEHMTLDLLDKMRELHAAGEGSESQSTKKGTRRQHQQTNFDIKIVERLQDLSNQLVKQTRELEQALAERTKQICQLRWELLHRDVSTVKLETELHRAHMQSSNNPKRSKCDIKRSKYAHFRSWSSEEASNRSQQLKECETDDTERAKPSNELPEAYYKLPKTEIQAIELSNTVHELNRELIRLSSAAESFLGGDVSVENDDLRLSTGNKCVVLSKWSEPQSLNKAVSTGFPLAIEANANSDASPTSQENELRSTKISVRRNSASSVSVVSMTSVEPERSTMFTENENVVSTESPPLKLYRKPTRNLQWSESDSSTEEEGLTRVPMHSQSYRVQRKDLGQETALKQTPLKQTLSRGYVIESDESQNIENESKQSQQGRKKKINCKVPKGTRKYNRNEFSCLQLQAASNRGGCKQQSESDTTINIVGTEEQVLRTRTNKDIAYNASAELRLVHSADQVASKTISITKRNSVVRKPAQMEYTSRLRKSHSDRATTHDSRIPQSKLTKVKKSESIEYSKELKGANRNTSSLNSVNAGEVEILPRPSDSKMRLRSYKKIPNHSPLRRRVTDETFVLPTRNSGNLVLPKQNDELDSLQLSAAADDIRNVPILDENSQLKDTKKKLTNKPFLNDFQEHSHSQYEAEPGNVFNSPEVSEGSIRRAETGERSRPDNCRPKMQASNKIDLDSPPSTFVLKLPKRKRKLSDQITCDKLRTSQQQTNTYEKSAAGKLDETITVIIPKSRYAKTKTNSQEAMDGSRQKEIPQTISIEKNAFATNFKNNEVLEKVRSEQYTNATGEVNCRTQSALAEDQKLYENFSNTCLSSSKKNIGNTDRPKLGTRTGNDFPAGKQEDLHSTSISKAIRKVAMPQRTDRIFNAKEPNYVSYQLETEIIKSEKESENQSVTLKSPAAATNNATKSKSCYYKSPSDTQLDWKKSCAKKLSREGAPNVKTLIEKYNQRVLENQTVKSSCSSAYNSPAVARKISAPPGRASQTENIPFCFSSTPNSPRIVTALPSYSPLTSKPHNMNIIFSQSASPPISPNSRARAEALQKAKEKFISSSSITAFGVESNTIADKSKQTEALGPENRRYVTRRSATDSFIKGREKMTTTEKSPEENEDNRKSLSSNRSSDSMNLVLCKSAQTCQESRLMKRQDKQKMLDNQSKDQDSRLKASKSLSNSSIFKTLTGHDIIFPPSFLRLRRSRKKKDMGTIGQLCRQSLLVGGETSNLADEAIVAKSSRSCPSSPETKSKQNKSKPSWLQRNIFRQK